MNAQGTAELIAAGLQLTIELSLPAICTALLVGLIISVFQSATQIQEQTLSTAPKIIIVFLVLIASGAWACAKMSGFTITSFSQIAAPHR